MEINLMSLTFSWSLTSNDNGHFQKRNTIFELTAQHLCEDCKVWVLQFSANFWSPYLEDNILLFFQILIILLQKAVIPSAFPVTQSYFRVL